MHGYNMEWLGGFWMILFWVIVLVGIIFLVYFLVRRRPGGEKQEKSPMEILRTRYAKGEISEEEFQRAKKEFTKDQKT